MSSRFRRRTSAQQGGNDDGGLVDAFFGDAEGAKASPTADRKLKQLCREVFRVLVQVVPGGLDDLVLQAVSLVDVVPAPDASRLAVQVHIAAGADHDEVAVRLQRLKGHLRSEIAAAIQRKRTPDLVFEVVS